MSSPAVIQPEDTPGSAQKATCRTDAMLNLRRVEQRRIDVYAKSPRAQFGMERHVFA
jgi:hypothetical protein